MISAGRCDRCGAPAPPSAALDGLCPACLLGVAILVPESADTARPGASLRILARLGAGPSSLAYLAEYPDHPGRFVVVKNMEPAPGVRDVAARVASLGERLRTLEHPAIARVFDLTLDAEGRLAAVTEFCPGIPVTRYCEQMEAGTPLREDLRSRVALALAHAHARGVVHGGLTATNVLVARGERGPVLKVLDFGHAALVGRGAAEPDAGEDLRALDALML
jgi:eukaryotic-like serine/threonine-protein kinase